MTSTLGQTKVNLPVSSAMKTASEMLLNVARCSSSDARRASKACVLPPFSGPLISHLLVLQRSTVSPVCECHCEANALVFDETKGQRCWRRCCLLYTSPSP